jgi:hypothetical protein
LGTRPISWQRRARIDFFPARFPRLVPRTGYLTSGEPR